LEFHLAEHSDLRFLLKCHQFGGQRNEITISLYHRMTGQHFDRHVLDTPFVEQELTLVLQDERLGKLPERRRATSLHEGADEQRLVNVAHAHLVFEEINELGKVHRACPPARG